jgi:predicted Fe-S protein YdhL (DUF1289 family)
MKFSIYTYKSLLVILLSLCAIIIIGCSKKIAEIPLENWNQLSEDEREIVLKGYNESQIQKL